MSIINYAFDLAQITSRLHANPMTTAELCHSLHRLAPAIVQVCRRERERDGGLPAKKQRKIKKHRLRRRAVSDPRLERASTMRSDNTIGFDAYNLQLTGGGWL